MTAVYAAREEGSRLLETAVAGCSVARRGADVEADGLEERRRGGRERVAGTGLVRVLEMMRGGEWRQGWVTRVREEAGRYRHWLTWAGSLEVEEVDLQVEMWRWAGAAQPMARERGGGGEFRQPRRRRGAGSGLKEVWTASACGMESDSELVSIRAAMAGRLVAAAKLAERGAGAASAVARQVRRAAASAQAPSRTAGEKYAQLVEVLGGMIEQAEWGQRIELRRAFEASVEGAQLAAARILGRWARRWHKDKAWARERNAGEGRMGAVLWAWREVARRQRGMGAQSTREAAERGQCGAVDWLPPTGTLEWSYRPGVTAVRSGSLAAWLMWYVRWTARERVENRRRWAAWRARAGRDGDLRRRYDIEVSRGTRRVGEAPNTTVKGRVRHEGSWAARCEAAQAMQDRMHSADEGGWVMWVHVTAEGEMQVSVRAEQERSARAKIREWGRAGVRAVLIEGANEAEVAAAGVTGERKRKRVAEREAVRMTRGARERFRSTQGEIIAAVATEGRGETTSGDLVEEGWEEPRSDEEEMEREAMAFGDG